METFKVKKILETAQLPTRMTPGSAGYDLYAAAEVVIPASQVTPEGKVEIGHALISTGLSLEIPLGMVGRIGSRSGLSVKANLEVGAGWIDSDYRGELRIEMKNLSAQPYQIKVGDRIAQLIIVQLGLVRLVEVDEIDDSARGAGGFGSTG